MPTANVSTTSPGSTPFTIDVTACDLLTDLAIKDFQVFVDGTINCSGTSCINWVKTSVTQLTYSGLVITGGTAIQIRRKTPNQIVQSIAFASRFSSSLWNSELDRILRWREEADLNSVGAGSTITVATPNDGVYPSGWNGDTSQPTTRNAIFDALQLFATVASPTFTGVPLAPTASDLTATTQLASVNYANTRVSNALSGSPTLGGNPTATSQAVNDNSTRLATTAFVQQELTGLLASTSTLGASYTSGFKNLLINGRFNVSQRGVSLTMPAAATFPSTYLMDNWRIVADANAGTTAAQVLSRETHFLGQTSVPNFPTFFLNLNNSTQGVSLGVGSFNFLLTHVENVTQFSNRPLTISFWAKSTLSGKVIAVEAVQTFGTGGSPSADTNTLIQRITLTTLWAKYTYTFTPPTLNAKTLGTNSNSSSLIFLFWTQAGSTFNSRVGGSPITWQGNGDFSLCDVQLEFGSLATTIEQRPVAADLALCQRYYESGTAYLRGYSLGNGETSTGSIYKVTKRVVPTVVVAATGQVGMVASPGAFSLGFHSHETRWNKDVNTNMFAWLSDFTADASF